MEVGKMIIIVYSNKSFTEFSGIMKREEVTKLLRSFLGHYGKKQFLCESVTYFIFSMSFRAAWHRFGSTFQSFSHLTFAIEIQKIQKSQISANWFNPVGFAGLLNTIQKAEKRHRSYAEM